MSQAGTIGGGGVTPSSDEFVVFLISPEIDFKVAGTTTLFTTPSNRKFMMIAYTQYMTSVVNFVDNASFDFGFNGPVYDNMDQGDATSVSVTDAYESFPGTTKADTPAVPANTPVVINVTAPAVATTTLTGKIIVQGFYFS